MALPLGILLAVGRASAQTAPTHYGDSHDDGQVTLAADVILGF